MFRRLLRLGLLLLLPTTLLTGCGPSSERTSADPGHKHAEEVGELHLPSGQ